MNQSFLNLTLPEIKEHRSDQMIALAQSLPNYDAQSLPSVEKVLKAIANGHTKELTLTDWLFCLIQKARWDDQHPQESRNSATCIWKAVLNYPEIQVHLIRRLAWYRSKVDLNAIASSFSETFNVFREGATGDAQLSSEIVELLGKEKSENQILNLIYQNNLTPTFLLKLDNFIPSSIAVIQTLPSQCVLYFLSLTTPTLRHVE